MVILPVIYFQNIMHIVRIHITVTVAATLAITFLLSSAVIAEAVEKMYKYADDRGAVHVTDNYGNIPERYRSSAKEVKVDNRAYGYTPSVDEAIGSEKYSTNAWFDYGSMPFYERWFLLARAGFIDITPILKIMAPWIGLASFVFAASFFLIFRVFETPAKKGAILMLVLAVVGSGLFIKYVRVVQSQSESLVRKVRQLRNVDAERQKRLIGVLESVSDERR